MTEQTAGVPVERDAARLTEAERALALLGDGVALVDRGGVVRVWNTAAAAITGVAEADVVGRPVAEAVPGWPAAPDAATASAPGRPRLETVAVGERWLSLSAVDFEGGTVYAFRDVTDDRRLEQLKHDFVATVSHELRTPLAAIYGAALTLRREEASLESEREGLLDVIAEESERLARIVTDVLWAARLDSGTLHVALERCDAASLAQQVAEAAGAHLPPGIHLRFEAGEALPPVAADPDRLRQVLTNLVDNAVKYSPGGGTVVLRIDAVPGGVRFSVSDEGLGIPPAEHARIFEKFYRLDPELTGGAGGTGLGLYISRELVRHMNGRLDVVSAPGDGSTFRVELPAAP